LFGSLPQVTAGDVLFHGNKHNTCQDQSNEGIGDHVDSVIHQRVCVGIGKNAKTRHLRGDYDFIDGDVENQKIDYFKERGIKIALDTRESLYSVPEILSIYKVDYIKLPFKLFKGISTQSKIAFENTMKTMEDYKVRPIVYEVDNYLEYTKCKELNLKYLQGDYMGVADNNKISNFIHPRQAAWIKNE
jgi:hypothetical protein